MIPSMTPLETFTTEELLREVSRRHDASAFIAKPLIGNTDTISSTTYHLQGDTFVVMGLVGLLSRIISDNMIGEVAADCDCDDCGDCGDGPQEA